MILELKGG